MCGCVLSLSILPNSSWPHWPTRLLCPWDFPGKHTGRGCHFLLQAVFQTWGSNSHLPCVLHCRRIFFYHWTTWEALCILTMYTIFFIDAHPVHLSIKLCDIIYLMFHFINFIHILFQLAVCVQYYNVVHKKLVHLFGLLTGSMWSSLIIILYQSLI